MAHTPGPWAWFGVELLSTAGFVLDTKKDGRPNSADASLIAAAPDLLAIAKDARHFLNGMVEIARIIGLAGTPEWDTLFGTNDGFGLIDEIDAAIAKAEGVQK